MQTLLYALRRLRACSLPVVVLMAIGIAGCGRSPTGSSASCPSHSLSRAPAGTIGATVDGLVATEMQTQHLAGMAVALAKQGHVIYAQGYGYADLSACLPVQSATPFELGSVTKTFTAAAILQLQSTGAVDIDTSVLTYLPGYPFDPRITVRMLLNQVSGLADYVNDPVTFPERNTWAISGASEQTILTAIAHAPLQFTPGSEYQYSNTNYFVLGSIIEATSSESYSDYLATKITGPLALTHTSLVKQPSLAALPYNPVGQRVPLLDPSCLFAAGGLWSDVLDLARWDAGLFSGRVLPPVQLTEMATPASASGYAMGLTYTAMANRPFVWHNGNITWTPAGELQGGSNAFNGFFLDDGFSISLLTNADPAPLKNANPIGGGIEQFYSFADSLIQAICTSSPSSSPTAC